jgi:mannitol-1-phosphate 5-dehydrogenase
VEAIAASDELATAIPSVAFFESGGEASIVSLLAAGLTPDRPRVLYACENHNYAAEILEEALRKATPAERLVSLRVVNTVIGKMSGVIQTPEAMARLGLTPMVRGGQRAVLVEAFNRILISRVGLPGFHRGIEVFEEKDDLLPFEEAKLYGHNAIHALLGYLAHERGCRVMSEVAGHSDLMRLGREAFLDESGAALIRKHGRLGDPLFTPAGYARYADDLLARMTNPFLHDEVDRVCRDPKRKLGYGDRLVGTMREALRQGIRPARMARGAAAALRYAVATAQIAPPAGLMPGAPLPPGAVPGLLTALWENEPADEFRAACIAIVAEAVAGRSAN